MSVSPFSIRRGVLRLLVLVVLLAVLIGAPTAVVLLLGSPVPSAAEWHSLWHRHEVSPDLAVHLGGAMFLLLWSWFAASAVHECATIRSRAGGSPSPRVRWADGPTGWIRGAVRFIALSSVSAGLLTGGWSAVGHAAPPAVHVVVTGDSYWKIADEQLDVELGRDATPSEVWQRTQQLIDVNAPLLGHHDPTLLIPGESVLLEATHELTGAGDLPKHVAPSPPAVAQPVPASVPDAPTPSVTAETVPAVTAPPTSAAADVVGRLDAGGSPAPYLLVGGGMFAAGVLARVRSRRGRVLRGSPSGVRLEAPSFRAARLEFQLRSIEPTERMARLDVGLRLAAGDLVNEHSTVLMATMDEMGDASLHLSSPASPADDLWRADASGLTWRLSSAVTLEELSTAALARTEPNGMFPCPALVQVGVGDDGSDVYVDLEQLGVLAIDSVGSLDIMEMLAASLAWSPWFEAGEVVALPSIASSCASVTNVEADQIWPLLERRQAARDTTFGSLAARTAGIGESSPLVAFSTEGRSGSDQAVCADRGVALVLAGTSSTPFRLRQDGDHHVLEPFGVRLTVTAADRDTLDVAAELIEEASSLPLAVIPNGVDHDARAATGDPPVAGASMPAVWREPRWDVLVTVLGPVSVQDRAGRPAEFEKAKAMELLVWLTQHRERPTRRAARAALWDLAVRDSTFANVVSDCRRSLARLVQPPHGEEWLGRTMSDDLPLHPRVITDADLLASRLAAARGLPPAAAVGLLRPGVELMHGLPFSGAGSGYLWVDGEGHTSSLVLLATGAAETLAEHHLALGDIDGVFWATGQGLRVLPCQEQLIALRMRAHALRGDTAGVRFEWEQYERALAADAWSGDEPSPKLAALRRELLAPAVAPRR